MGLFILLVNMILWLATGYGLGRIHKDREKEKLIDELMEENSQYKEIFERWKPIVEYCDRD